MPYTTYNSYKYEAILFQQFKLYIRRNQDIKINATSTKVFVIYSSPNKIPWIHERTETCFDNSQMLLYTSPKYHITIFLFMIRDSKQAVVPIKRTAYTVLLISSGYLGDLCS